MLLCDQTGLQQRAYNANAQEIMHLIKLIGTESAEGKAFPSWRLTCMHDEMPTCAFS